MQSGIVDYDDDFIYNLTFNNPSLDLGPYDYLYMQNKTLACDPGTCMYYSSINYILAGLVLAQYTNCTTFEELVVILFNDLLQE